MIVKNKKARKAILIISAAVIFSAAVLFVALIGRQYHKMALMMDDMAKNEETVRTIAAYIKDIQKNRIIADVIEFVTDDDVERKNELIEELNLKEGSDLFEGRFPDGYFIYNADTETAEWKTSDQTIYKFIDWDYDYTGYNYPIYCITTDINIFNEYSGGYDRIDPLMPFFFEVADDAVISVTERFIQNQKNDAGTIGNMAKNEETVRTIAAYIKDIQKNRIIVDVIEFVTDDDVERKNELIEELNLKEGSDLFEGRFPDGYFIYNADTETAEWKTSDQTIYKFIDWNYDYTGLNYPAHYLTTDINIFNEYSGGYDRDNPRMPFFFEVAGDTVISVTERFMP